MNTALLITSAIALLTVAGGVVAFFAAHSAPVGFEDADGFHLVNETKRAQAVPVSASHDAHPAGARFAA
jgi:hypothetical protein